MSTSNPYEYLDYETIATLNEQHHIYLIQDPISKHVYVKKELLIYSIEVYQMLKENPISGVPKILDYYEHDHKLTVIEEYINGELLREKIDQGQMTENEICNYIFQLCKILEQLHHNTPPIVHRDIKPSNVMITTRGEVVLIDFNAAKFHSQQDNRTSDTVLLGTQGYAAPEQYGFGESSSRTDIYSLGILFEECLESIYADKKKYDFIINHCTRMDPADRYEDIADLKKQLQFWGTRRYDRGYALPGFRTRSPWKMFCAVFAYLLLLLMLFTTNESDASAASYVENFIICAWLFLNILIFFNYRGILDYGLKPNDSIWKKRILHAVLWSIASLILVVTLLSPLKTLLS